MHCRCRAFVFQRFFKVAALKSESRLSKSSCLGKIVFRKMRGRKKKKRDREKVYVSASCIKQKEKKGEKGRNETLLSFYEHLQQPGLSSTRYDGITFFVRDHKHVRLRFLSTVVTEFEKWIFLRWRHGGRVTAFRLFILNPDLWR